ncbi:DNA polymerase III subunit chi [Georgfuchsia toluolica]|uniref:DNA polymerase III subunit chi n=1 Tax=Georgfuchsia toluolica TaxID=424218 RepID=A0A916J8U7_9PROT|nr:DNA polymerase III subunit chi [Georgfuchsia toluolica]CAG4885302.1 DNA polymerase III subunit chi [Georgfuchsia toluolica]
MTRVHFFHGANDRIEAAVAWLHGAWARRQDTSAQLVVVFAPDAALADRIDRQLWLQPAGGFVPHCLAGSPLAAETPVIISDSLAALDAHRQLLNLSDQVPSEFSRFDEVVEIVSQAGPDKLPARERFKFYRERGYELNNQDISAGFS